MFTFTSHWLTCTPCHHRIDEADEHWMQTQDVSTFVSRFWRESWRFVAAVFTKLPGSSLLWPRLEGGSCVLGVIAHVIHTSPPPLYTSPGPVRGSTYPVKDLWSCLVIPVLTFFSPHREPPAHCDAPPLSQSSSLSFLFFESLLCEEFAMIQWLTTTLKMNHIRDLTTLPQLTARTIMFPCHQGYNKHSKTQFIRGESHSDTDKMCTN